MNEVISRLDRIETENRKFREEILEILVIIMLMNLIKMRIVNQILKMFSMSYVK
jgi:hypothetical protein